ncbi:hypothetical protein Axi01nite_44160 [Actinoplanes xinjiangensis]|nr:hypothetical protein Axi01nite_44160 [Actinoplanes xinjiangensis]
MKGQLDLELHGGRSIEGVGARVAQRSSLVAEPTTGDLFSYRSPPRRNIDDPTKHGLTQPYSSGAAEGQVDRINTLKRAMYGRANLALLRQRILIPH